MPRAKFNAYLKAFKRKERRTSERFAMIASIIANVNRGKDTAPFKIEDFIGEDDTLNE